MQYTLYTIPLAIAGLLVSGVAVYSWHYRRIRSALPFAVMVTAIAVWPIEHAPAPYVQWVRAQVR